MMSYALLGSNRLDHAKAFYDTLLGAIGIPMMSDLGARGRIYGTPGVSMFGIVGPFNGEPATVGNGTMIGFSCADREAVDRFHATALELGGTCDGAPGQRGPEGPGGAYMAYVRDLDGNKICAMKLG